ncbi:MAG: CDP-alcohol phosphatidyltransferase family protein [Anaerolineales bacterium]|jgi:CDP-diacylglycerol--glycerol-3-phosphate 3-phosphatidyltransferase|nr:CDP-alcohol phosphatidyltransferase family protein [Anaerolineales bacterium]
MTIPLPLETTVLATLRRSWALFAFLSIAYLATGYFLLSSSWQAASAAHWLLQAGLATSYLLAVAWRNLAHNRRPGETTLLPNLGWGNWMTMLRGLGIAGVIGFLFSPRPPGWLAWLPAILYSLAVIADILDGYLARKTNHTTRLGVILDLSFDGLGVLAAAVLLVQFSQAPAIYLLVAAARYLFLAGEWLLRRLGRATQPLPPSLQRRIFASLQFVFIAVALYPVFPPSLTRFAALCFALPFLVGFGRDFLLVGGFIRPAAAPTRFQRLIPLLQLFLRLALTGLAIVSAAQILRQGITQTFPGLALLLLQTLAAILVLLGVAVRISAGVALGLLGLSQNLLSPALLQYIQVAAYSALVFLGGTRYSLWTPEEIWYRNPPGQTRRHAQGRSADETLPETS